MRTITLALLLASAALAAPTFTKDVAPILYRNCVSCHRPGEIAPMSLLDYKTARPWAKAIREAVLTRRMPPWFADPNYGHFANDTRLAARDIETIKAWVDSGSAQGNPGDLPHAPAFKDGWQLGKPDIVIDIGQDFHVPPGIDRYEYFTVPTNFKEGQWIRAAQVLPGNRKVVHHVHVHVVTAEFAADVPNSGTALAKKMPFFEINNGLTRVRDDAPVVDDACKDSAGIPSLQGFEEGSIATMLPGKPPDVFDVFGDGSTAKYIPPGASLRFQVHYARVEKAAIDRTSVGFYLAKRVPERALKRVDLRNRFFLIPPGDANHAVRRCLDVEKHRLLVAITPHMHYRGKDARYELVHTDGRRETLLVVPHYNFNWQLQYRFAQPVLMEKGSRLEVTFL